MPIGPLLSLTKCLFRSSNFVIGLGFWGWVVWVLYICYYFGYYPLTKYKFANIFSHSVNCLFISLMVSFAVQKLLNVMYSYLFIFAFVSFALMSDSVTHFQMSGHLLPSFSSRSISLSGLTFKSLIHFYFCVWCEIVIQFHSFACDCPSFPNTVYWRDCPFPMVYSWFLCHGVIDSIRDKNLKLLFSLCKESMSLVDFVETSHQSLWAKRSTHRGFPGGVEEKNLPVSAGHVGSFPGPGRSHVPQICEACVPQLLSLCSRAQELQLLKPTCATARAPQEKPLQWEACAPQLENSPCSPQPGKARIQQQRPSTAK